MPLARRHELLALAREYGVPIFEDELWVADITYLRCWEGVVFFAFVVDAWIPSSQVNVVDSALIADCERCACSDAPRKLLVSAIRRKARSRLKLMSEVIDQFF
jgi:hypothetical protein